MISVIAIVLCVVASMAMQKFYYESVRNERISIWLFRFRWKSMDGYFARKRRLTKAYDLRESVFFAIKRAFKKGKFFRAKRSLIK